MSQYWDVINLYGCANSSKNDFNWVEETSQINKDLIKNYNEGSRERYFLKVHSQYS